MINELQKYYDERQVQLKAYLENELKKFKDENNRYLSQVVAEACEHAKNLLETSNKKAFERFEQAKNQFECKTQRKLSRNTFRAYRKVRENNLGKFFKV